MAYDEEDDDALPASFKSLSELPSSFQSAEDLAPAPMEEEDGEEEEEPVKRLPDSPAYSELVVYVFIFV
jgi:hypothetical protein